MLYSIIHVKCLIFLFCNKMHTNPIFPISWTKSVFVIVPGSTEMYRPIKSSLNNLKKEHTLDCTTSQTIILVSSMIGLVCILLQNRNIKHLTCIILYNIVYYYCLLLICRGPTNCFDHPLFLVDVKTKNTIKICG
jgi:uncharacterized Zn-finger protein